MIHETAVVDNNIKIDDSTKVWHWAQIRENSKIGKGCIIGKSTYIGCGVKIGDYCKIQNNSSIYQGSILKKGVFIGPHCVLTNDKNPRAVNTDFSLKNGNDWQIKGITIKKGASIGARTVILPGVTIGAWAMIGAGSVVTKDIPSYSLAYGNPARVRGKVNKKGEKIE